MSKTHDLIDYAFSKKVMEELPKARIILEKFKIELEPYQHFLDCHKVIKEIENSIISIDLHLGVYGVVKSKKGLLDE